MPRLNFCQFLKFSAGYTLVELLVVIAIIGTLVGLLLPQISEFNQGQDLKNQAEILKSALRVAQSNATSGLRCGSDFNPQFRARNWYVIFTDSTHYKIAPDCFDDSGVAKPALPATDYVLKNNVSIKEITVTEGNVVCLDYGLTTARPKIVFSNISSIVNLQTLQRSIPDCLNQPDSLVTITLQLMKNGAIVDELAVTVAKGGQIAIQ